MRPTSFDQFTVLDWILAVVGGGHVVALALFPSTHFGAMFADLGSPEDLPLLSRLAVAPWFSLGLAVLPLVALVMGVLGRGALPRQRAWVVGAFVLGCLGLGVCFVAVYLPIFSIAGKIKAD